MFKALILGKERRERRREGGRRREGWRKRGIHVMALRNY